MRTIQTDLKDLAEDTDLGFYLPIFYDESTKSYYYSEIPNNIFPSLELEPEEVTALLFYAKTVSQYKEYPIFKQITNAVQKVLDNSNISPEIKALFEKETLLETEKHPQVGGTELIASILDAISKKRIVVIEYQKFDDEIKSHKIKPILLKEDKQLWYIIGINVKYDRLITFALDRIIDVTITEEIFDEISFDSKEYFKFSFGITVADVDPIDVVISFDPEQGNYLKTLPIHHSQIVIEDTIDRFVIQVSVKPSYEFFSKILSYGSLATVLTPKSVRNTLQQMLKKAISTYKNS
ncbi:MAG: hypothetical protein A2W93_07780 [Bacteroidetes bacterium GWF2_43_63]|nr:MAG: hypothetical protein A2W94_09635 [Bacteroidetes bacterium GWE2_42_42]OFY53068.1 MAG: hypothetical protein A2W93_07780 [Bacteroidetes bacterium GWF2_43_63]